MTTVNRYDRAILRARRTDEGYLVDEPIVGRVGIQVYRLPDGTVRRELRPPEEVFANDSLESYAGKPITDGHPQEMVTSKNAKSVAIGFMTSAAKQEQNNVIVPIVIHDEIAIDKAIKGGKRELSLGYRVDLIEEHGIWNGEEYDAIQRNIRINHLSLVKSGRAGNARLNLDRRDAVSIIEGESMGTETLGRIRLDSGLEYQAAPEVIVAFEKMRNDVAEKEKSVTEKQGKIDALQGECDTLKAKVQSEEQIKKDALDAARAEVKARVELEKVASDFKVDCADKTDREVKEAIIKTVRADADLSGKSDEYINASFDIAVELKKDSAIAAQRKAGEGATDKKQPSTYKGFMSQLGKKE